MTAPTLADPIPDGSPRASLVGIWTSTAVDGAGSVNPARNFQWEITSQSDTSVSRQLLARAAAAASRSSGTASGAV